jgi:hypothetical protein
MVLKDAAKKEAAAVLPECTRSLIRRAQNRLPEEARTRFEEEWPAGFEESIEKRPAWALAQAVSLYRGARQIAAELEPAPASASAGGPAWIRGFPGTTWIGQWAAAIHNLYRRIFATRWVDMYAEAMGMHPDELRGALRLLSAVVLFATTVIGVIVGWLQFF